ncbi:hypothetical protein G7Z17_g2552 [Cylindrodendrum hubeiense]|uniref:Zn(2)-C6 fungal-type domain-containing protein n=1 Tax=Cylindrodendrum hubeiense TaxID=595255 RepID=A0A9P5LEC7_9HYPO|nr:hypothetical protein G7Z17_g2552 [Cylindrodendrum hubeiense]
MTSLATEASDALKSDAPKRHRRSNGGCVTCRIRRIKCDEIRPSCKRCTSSGRKCDGYPVPKPKTQAHESIAVVVMGPAGMPCATRGGGGCAAKSRTSLEMFSERYAPMLCGYGTPGFWHSVVLRACVANEGIKHLVIAASNLHMVSQLDLQASNLPFLAHYGRALQVLSRAQDSDVVVILVACVLLTVCDDLQNRGTAQHHILAGQRILRAQNDLALRPWTNSGMLEEIVSTFSRLSAPRPAMAGAFFEGGAATCIGGSVE